MRYLKHYEVNDSMKQREIFTVLDYLENFAKKLEEMANNLNEDYIRLEADLDSEGVFFRNVYHRFENGQCESYKLYEPEELPEEIQELFKKYPKLRMGFLSVVTFDNEPYNS